MKLPMLFRPSSLPTISLLLSFVLLSPLTGHCQETATAPKKTDKDTSGAVAIKLGDDAFTTLELKKYRRPILYPVLGPGQVPMTRNHPMEKGVTGEAEDHPHHKSIWCGHGLINGVSFWHEEGEIKFDDTKPFRLKVESDKLVTVGFHCNYLDKDGKLVCTDSNKLVFQELPDGARSIDWDITIHASEGELLFGDTKEGMMAVRTHPSLRIDKGAVAKNSEGVEGKAIWGQKAKWLDYSAKVEGKHVGVAIFDHPKNLRHPTTWHARAYGLVAANPFGLHHFEGKEKGAGDFKVAKGESVRWQYRFVFHEGDSDAAKITELYEAYKN